MAELQQFLDILIGTHCHSHRLNLVIDASCNAQCVRNDFDQIKEISYFFQVF